MASDTEKLLEIPELSVGAGYEDLSTVYDTFEDWSLLHKVLAFVCDTITSNTRHLNRACVLLEHKLDCYIGIYRYTIFGM